MLKQQIDNIVNSFEGMSLEEMDQVKLMNRVDTKFAFRIDFLLQLLEELKSDYKVFEIQGTRTPSYESLYFDDERFSFFRDHHNGKMNRFKVRFRKYVESNLHFLEIKHKFKGRTNKQRILADDFNYNFSSNQKEFLENVLNEQVDLKACMWNSFHRITLVNKTENERLTLDFDILFHWKEERFQLDKLVIAELKQEELNRNSAFYKIMKKSIIRPYRLSKYCIGSIELHGTENLKYNRFKKKLLTLKKINDAA